MNLTNTDDCDDLLCKIEEHNKKINEIKADIFAERYKKYIAMKDSDLTCEVIEEGQESILTHKVKFYMVKSNLGKRNKKLVLEISHSTLVNPNSKNLDYWTENTKKTLSKLEYNIFYMFLCKTQKEYVEMNKEKKIMKEEESKKLWEKVTRDINEAFRGVYTGQVIPKSPEIKAMIKDIIKQGYRQLAKKYHPDAAHDDGNLMQVLNFAKQQLEMIIGERNNFSYNFKNCDF